MSLPKVKNIKKEKAISLLANGFNYRQTCKILKLTRKSLWQWRHDPSFLEAIENERKKLAIDSQDDTISLINEANALLRKSLQENTKVETVKTALAILAVFFKDYDYKEYKSKLDQLF